jgi:YggT family protein
VATEKTVQGNAPTAISYLFGTLIDLYVTAILLRVLLQWVRADFYNPVCQFLVTLTNPPLKPLRRVIPALGRLDTAAVLLMLVLEFFSVWLANRLSSTPLGPAAIALFSVTKLAAALLMTYFFLIIAAVILSWVGAQLRHPVIPLVFQLTEPVLRPFRRVIPPIAGIDLTPIFALIAIRFLLLLIGW